MYYVVVVRVSVVLPPVQSAYTYGSWACRVTPYTLQEPWPWPWPQTIELQSELTNRKTLGPRQIADRVARKVRRSMTALQEAHILYVRRGTCVTPLYTYTWEQETPIDGSPVRSVTCTLRISILRIVIACNVGFERGRRLYRLLSEFM
jgi:hypothetical protein